ncbi:MAG: hypothetical protein JO007_01680 [Alphaproteobacteria bacterium]|nr:hypothetical protein [Alphaproteobacteria bacterium]
MEHRAATTPAQRVFGIALGYEVLNDRHELRRGPIMAVLAGKLSTRYNTQELHAGGRQIDTQPARIGPRRAEPVGLAATRKPNAQHG